MKPEFVADALWNVIPEERREDIVRKASEVWLFSDAEPTETFDHTLVEVMEPELHGFFYVDRTTAGFPWKLVYDDRPEIRRYVVEVMLRLKAVARDHSGAVVKAPYPIDRVWGLAEIPEDGLCPCCRRELSDQTSVVDGKYGVVHQRCAEGFAVVVAALTAPVIATAAQKAGELDSSDVEVAGADDDEGEVLEFPSFADIFE